MVIARNKKRKDRGKDRRFLNGKMNKRMTSITNKVSVGAVVTIAVIVLAYIYNRYKLENNSQVLEKTLTSLLREESSVAVNPNIKVALGFGSCQDIIVQSNEVIFDSAPDNPEHYYSISTKEQFLKVFAYFYRFGAAAERFISNSSFFAELVKFAREAPSARYFIGGNAPVMAKRFSKEGWKNILLGAQVSQSLQKEFPPGIQISGPIVEEDDIHLLLEYPSGQKWGSFVPPRANRFIVHNDHQNPQLSSLGTFVKEVEKFKPDVLVIGGLQMMDNFPMPESKQRDRLQKVQELMKSQPDERRIHFEMASFSDENLLRNLVENVIPYADSLGMNEQELPNLYQMIEYGNISLLADSRPRIADILDEMRKVYKVLQEGSMNQGHRKLTRLHVHTLAFQAFMVQKNSPWKNIKAAAAKAALTANRHTCGSDTIDVNKAKLLMDDAFTTSSKPGSRRIPFDPKDPVSCWDENNYTVCIAPVLVCTDVLQTGGGGDNISSSGLVLQI
ncbi:ADP-dependent glucokinase [Parasteatoda tepidariorum]|uniref:ADP-dependent glucokinase n=1 Tax=Parasteatoda tepidariorum TaxID=114398 RepID=UPI00077FB845|nr:ADP-dependent glucokinase [Parasteatoda tepidariorum]